MCSCQRLSSEAAWKRGCGWVLKVFFLCKHGPYFSTFRHLSTTQKRPSDSNRKWHHRTVVPWHGHQGTKYSLGDGWSQFFLKTIKYFSGNQSQLIFGCFIGYLSVLNTVNSSDKADHSKSFLKPPKPYLHYVWKIWNERGQTRL